MDEVEVIIQARVAIKVVGIHFAANLRFPGQCKSAQGQSEPKARPKGVVDGERVNIPVPLRSPTPKEGWRELGERTIGSVRVNL